MLLSNRLLITIAACCFLAFMAEVAIAQNTLRAEEEIVKDKEKEIKIQEYLKKKEKEEKKLLSAPITADELEEKKLVEVVSIMVKNIPKTEMNPEFKSELRKRILSKIHSEKENRFSLFFPIFASIAMVVFL